MQRDVATWVLPGAGVGLELLATLGVLLMRDALDRLHYAGASSFGIALVCAAVLVAEGPSLIGLKALLTAAFLLLSGPVLVHATARAIHGHREASE